MKNLEMSQKDINYLSTLQGEYQKFLIKEGFALANDVKFRNFLNEYEKSKLTDKPIDIDPMKIANEMMYFIIYEENVLDNPNEIVAVAEFLSSTKKLSDFIDD